MIPYEDLCQALDHYNRRLRGEQIPVEEYTEEAASNDYDIVESAAEGEVAIAADDMVYTEEAPDVTAETAVPAADFGGGEVGSDQYGQPDPYAQSDQYAQAGYDSGAVPGAPADQMPAEQYSSGQQAAAQYPEGYDPQQQQYQEGYAPQPQQQYPEGYDPQQQQYQEGYDPQQAQQQYPDGTYPDDQDPNKQQ